MRIANCSPVSMMSILIGDPGIEHDVSDKDIQLRPDSGCWLPPERRKKFTQDFDNGGHRMDTDLVPCPFINRVRVVSFKKKLVSRNQRKRSGCEISANHTRPRATAFVELLS